MYYRVSGKIQFQRTFKDWEPGCRIMCSECSQVSGTHGNPPVTAAQSELEGPCLVPQLPAEEWSCISLQYMPI